MIGTKLSIGVIILAILQYLTKAATFEALGSHYIASDFNIDLVDVNTTSLDDGYDINFWIKDATSDTHNFDFFTAFDKLVMSISHSSLTNVTQLKLVYNSVTLTKNVYTNGTPRWINIEIQAKSNIIMNAFAFDAQTFTLAPVAEFKFTSLASFSNATLTLHQGASPLGVYFAELRVYSLDLTNWRGINLRRYNLVSNLHSQLVEYVRVTQGNLVLNAHNSTFTSVALTNTIEFPFQLCGKGYKISSNTSQWNECTAQGCEYCQIVTSSYADLCRECDTTYFSWSASIVCPIDYYIENGICLRCPIGCSECSSDDTCTACDSGLSLATLNDSSIICKCSDGFYGTENASTDTLNWNACASPCDKCESSGTNWIGCDNPNFLLGSTCTPTWGTSKYGDSSNYECENWGSNCDVCTDNVTCTTCSATYLLSEGEWVVSCPINSLTSGTDCNTCDTGWAVCDTIVSNCTSCEEGYFLDGDTCVDDWGDGYYGDDSDNTCQIWDTSLCTKCISFTNCTECISTKTLLSNGTCGDTCETDEFQDQYSASIKFCRSCPSTCQTWTNMTKCDDWKPIFYMHTISVGSIKWVSSCPQGTFDEIDGSSNQICTDCLINCVECQDASTWDQWDIGYVSQPSGATDTCQASWDTGYYDNGGVWDTCDANCDDCDRNNECNTCASGYALNDTLWITDATCTGDYYISSGVWTQCPTMCTLCSSASIWSQWAEEYSLSGSTWVSNWGNSVRNELETWDDGNTGNGDGWSNRWRVESNYVWYTRSSPLADIWYCDPKLISAKWINNWKEIEMIFGTEIKINTTSLGSSASNNSITLCTQIIDSSLHSSLGAKTKCYFNKDVKNRYILKIDFSPDATFGLNQPSILKLNHLKTNNGCVGSILGNFSILGLPLEAPVLTLTASAINVSLWADKFTLDIYSSSGMTNRKPQSTSWSVLSVGALTTSSKKVALHSLVSTNYANMKSIQFDEETIANVTGLPVEIRVNVTNFLGKTSTLKTVINFLSTKNILIEGVYSKYILLAERDNKFFVSAKIPTCSGDDIDAIIAQEKLVTILWELYKSDAITLVQSLIDCLIPAYTMTAGTSYKLKFTAVNPSNSSMSASKWSDINVNNSAITVFINGGNRKISLDVNNTFTSNVEPKTLNLVYSWSCYEANSGSFCLSPDHTYSVLPNYPTIVIKNGALYPDRDYIITLRVKDIITNISASNSIMIYATTGALLDVQIESRHNKNGYIDFTLPSLFVCTTKLNGTEISSNNSTYSWAVIDSTGGSVSLSGATKTLNSLRLQGRTLSQEKNYIVQVNVTYESYSGSADILYTTEIGTDYEFQIEPSSGTALTTNFVVSAITQSFNVEINEFVFGYIKDGKKHLLTRASPVNLHSVILPQGESNYELTVFCEVIPMHDRVYYLESTVTVLSSNMQESEFLDIIDETVVGSIEDSIKIRLMYEHFRENMQSNQTVAINDILDGLQRDGNNLQLHQDDESRLTAVQSLEIISEDFITLNEQNIIIRAVGVFYQLIVKENFESSTNGIIFEVSDQSMESIFKFVDNVLSAIHIVDISLQNDLKIMLQKGLEYSLKGSTANDPLSNTPVVRIGNSTSVSTTKITLNGFDDVLTSNLATPGGSVISVRIPKSAMSNKKYLQLTTIMTNDLVYRVITVNSGSSIKTGMIKIILSETDATVGIADTKIKSLEMDISNLSDPIEIDIPFSGDIDEEDTLECGYTTQSNNIISSEGINTIIHDNYCTCQTTHLTDFMIEEYRKIKDVQEQVEVEEKVVEKLKIEKCVAFWFSLILLVALIPLLIIAKKKDLKDIEKYGPEGPPGIKQFALFIVILMSVRSKEKAEKQAQARIEEDEKKVEELNRTNDVSNSFAVNNLNTSDMDLIRNRTLPPKISQFDTKEEEGDKEEYTKEYMTNLSKNATTTNQIKIAVYDDSREEDKDSYQRHSEEDIEEMKGEPIIDNVFAKDDPIAEPDIDTGMISREEKENIEKQLKKRKRRKRKKSKAKNTFIEDNMSAAESIQKADSYVSKISNPDLSKNQSKHDSDMDLEGGDDNDNVNTDGIDTGYNVNTENNLGESNRLEASGRKKLKKKKLVKRKKINKDKIFEESELHNDPLYFEAKDKSLPFGARSKMPKEEDKTQHLSDSESSVSRDDSIRPGSPDAHDIPITLTEEGKAKDDGDEEYVYKEKAEERHYDGRLFCKTLKYGYRFTNMITFFDERSPRILRVMVVYSTCFIMLFTTGMFFFSYDGEGSISGINLFAWFGVALFCTIADWFMYIMLYLMFLHKPRHYKKYKYMIENNVGRLDQTSDDITDDTKSRPQSSQTQAKSFNPEDDKKRKSTNRNVTLLAAGFSVMIIVTCWSFIIIMASKYTLKAGTLWAISLGFTILLDLVLLEPIVLYNSSTAVYSKKLDLREQKFHPLPAKD